MERSKAEHRLALLINKFPECIHKLVKHYMVAGYEYIRLEINCPENIKIPIREFWRNNELIRYGYQLVIGNKTILRYDNTPHHPEIETFPHHKHVLNEVQPLYDNSIESFIEEILKIIRQRK